MDHYVLLGIGRNSKQEEIRHAYRELAHQFHPDSHIAVSQETKEKLNVVFSAIANAYTVLTHPDKKLHYDQDLLSRKLN